MNIILAESAGFCFGVKAAVDGVYENLKKGKIVTYGPIIHNKHVTLDLEKKGVRIIESLKELSTVTDETVAIRAHGVGLPVYDYLDKHNIKYVDYTCPFVKKIHERVKEKQKAGFDVIIIGESEHPEVKGIYSHANENAIIIRTPEEAENIAPGKKYAVVVQTTYKKEIFDKIVENIKKIDPYADISNTICSATSIRQKDAMQLSQIVEYMVVIGDKTSSNSTKLYEICKKNCEKTYFIESIDEIQLKIFKDNAKIGVTAGASTPPAAIKEALRTMKENDNDNNQTFEEMLDSSFVALHNGEVVKGTIIQITPAEVSVNLGYKSDGIITKDEMSEDGSFDLKANCKLGDEIEAVVLRVNDGEGNVLLSRKRVVSQQNMVLLEEAFNNKTIIKGRVVDIVKGGLIALMHDVRVFIPSSQIASHFTADLTVFKGQEFDFHIIEFNKEKRRIVAGRRELAKQEEILRKKIALERLQEGADVEGTVSRIVNFGVFVDLGGIDGLIHLSELSWIRGKKISDLLSVGAKVKVRVLSIDPEKEKVSISLKALETDPWENIETKYPLGKIVEGTVVRTAQFGAFVELEPGVDGLVHISQISRTRISKVEDALSVGERITAKIIVVDAENKKISLSKKEAEEIIVEEEKTEAVEKAEAVVEEKAEEAIEKAEPAAEEAVEKAEAVVEEKAEEAIEKAEPAAEEAVEKVEPVVEEKVEEAIEKAEETVEKTEPADEA